MAIYSHVLPSAVLQTKLHPQTKAIYIKSIVRQAMY